MSGDPRERNLKILGGIALVAVLAALIALWAQSTGGGGQPEQRELFPGLASKVAHHAVTHIHIASKANGVIDVALHGQNWVITSSGNYPASSEQVNGTLVGLAAMQIIEPKTSNPEMLQFVGLDMPPKGDGVLVRLSDDSGKTLAALIAGKTSDIGDATGATGLFARRAGENQAYLVRSVTEIRSGTTDWMEKTVMDVDRARIREVDVTPPEGPAYSVTRAKPSDADFTLTPIPKGREVGDPSSPDGAAEAIVGFSFDDAKRAEAFDFAHSSTKLVTKTFDGLTVTVTVVKAGNDSWAAVSATSDNPKSAKEAAEINAKAAGWAYKLATYKAAQFTAPLENLLKPKEAPATTAP